MCLPLLADGKSSADVLKKDARPPEIFSIAGLVGIAPIRTGESLNAQQVIVRPFHPGDARVMFEAARESIEQLRAWMTWCRPEYSMSDAELFVSSCGRASQKGEHFSFAILDAQTGRFLGSAGLNHINLRHKFANVGYWIRKSANGKGVATSAVQKVAEFGFAELGLNRLEFLIPALNVASQRVAQKVGAEFEGVLKHRLIISGKSHDAVMYSLMRPELKTLRIGRD
jgi:ribosomal-protein-serine acetyltransferase